MPRSAKPRKQPEFELHCVVVDLLRTLGKRGLFWFHPANGEKRSPRAGARLARMGVVRGVPDLVLLWKGKAIGLELKADKGRQDENQRAVQLAWEQTGNPYYCAAGYQAALGFLMMLDCIHPVHGTRFAPREPAEAAA